VKKKLQWITLGMVVMLLISTGFFVSQTSHAANSTSYQPTHTTAARFAASTGIHIATVGVAATAAATTQPSDASIATCVRSLVVPRKHTSLTVAEAEQCAHGASVYYGTPPLSGPSNSLYIVVQNGKAVIYRTSTSTTSTSIQKPSTPPAARTITASTNSCWWRWTSGYVSWWGGDNGGSISAGGWGNHCGYSNITGYTLSKWCVCSGMSYQTGSYDSNYGAWAYKYPYAAVWANGDLSTSFVQWQNFIRLYENSYGGWWSYIQLG